MRSPRFAMRAVRSRAAILAVAVATTAAVTAAVTNLDPEPPQTSAAATQDGRFQAAALRVGPAPLPTLDPQIRDESLGRRADVAVAAAEAAAREAAEAEAEARRQAEQQQAAAAAAPSTPSGSVWDRLAQCESSGNWASTVGLYEGGLQFHPGTWDAYKPAGYPEAAYQASRDQQIAVAELVLADQGWGAWPACSRKLGLR